METVSGVLLVAGAVFVLLAAVGVVRFHHTFERMHAASKASSLGIMLLGLGGVIVLDVEAATALVLVVVLHLVTVPIGSHLVGRSAHDDGVDGATPPD